MKLNELNLLIAEGEGKVHGTSIMVEVHEDHVIIKNPGGFPSGMSQDKVGALSIRRNELIADIFARMHRTERMGSEFKRIRESMVAAGLPFPKISSDDFFFIEFERPERPGEGGQKVTAKQTVVLNIIRETPSISRDELANKLRINVSAVRKHLDALRKKGLLSRVGPDKGGHWEILG